MPSSVASAASAAYAASPHLPPCKPEHQEHLRNQCKHNCTKLLDGRLPQAISQLPLTPNHHEKRPPSPTSWPEKSGGKKIQTTHRTFWWVNTPFKLTSLKGTLAQGHETSGHLAAHIML
ncbi:hypothetical protein B0H14DRAFT_3493185 [Mycena olivaceomarginata]|nr:hypothetical protein B0H14DRAFT_3493185 [Mycena olivaceomarginata]